MLEAGRSEERRVVTMDALADVTVGRLMTRRPVTVATGSTLADVATMLQGTARHTAHPVLDGDAIRGLLPLHVLAETPPPEWARRTVGECLIPVELVPHFAATTPALEAAEELARGASGRALIIEDGALAGILSLSDIARALAIGRRI